MKVVVKIKKHLFLIGLFFLILSQAYAWASDDVVLVKSADIKPYNEAVKGFRSAFGGDVEEILITEVTGTGVLGAIHKRRPNLMVVVGLDALSSVKEVTDIPIIYAMVSNPKALISGKKNITGVSLDISFDKQLTAFLEIMPEIKRIGVIYDSRNTGHLLKEAQSSASQAGVELILREVNSPKEVPRAVKDMKGKIDAFWMLPDTTVLTHDNEEYLFLFFIENGIPILTFSERYVEMGALMALSIDAFDIGKQIGEIANRIKAGNGIGNVPKSSPRRGNLIINLKIAKKLGIPISEEIIHRAKVIR